MKEIKKQAAEEREAWTVNERKLEKGVSESNQSLAEPTRKVKARKSNKAGSEGSAIASTSGTNFDNFKVGFCFLSFSATV